MKKNTWYLVGYMLVWFIFYWCDPKLLRSMSSMHAAGIVLVAYSAIIFCIGKISFRILRVFFVSGTKAALKDTTLNNTLLPQAQSGFFSNCRIDKDLVLLGDDKELKYKYSNNIRTIQQGGEYVVRLFAAGLKKANANLLLMT